MGTTALQAILVLDFSTSLVALILNIQIIWKVICFSARQITWSSTDIRLLYLHVSCKDLFFYRLFSAFLRITTRNLSKTHFQNHYAMWSHPRSPSGLASSSTHSLLGLHNLFFLISFLNDFQDFELLAPVQRHPAAIVSEIPAPLLTRFNLCSSCTTLPLRKTKVEIYKNLHFGMHCSIKNFHVLSLQYSSIWRTFFNTLSF